MPFEYVFNGKVFPERTTVNVDPIHLDMDSEFGIKGTLVGAILLSQISVVFTSECEVHDIATLKNFVEDAIRLEVDILGYLLGCGYDIEIASVTDISCRVSGHRGE